MKERQFRIIKMSNGYATYWKAQELKVKHFFLAKAKHVWKDMKFNALFDGGMRYKKTQFAFKHDAEKALEGYLQYNTPYKMVDVEREMKVTFGD